MKVIPKVTWRTGGGLAGEGKCNCGRIVIMVLHESVADEKVKKER